MKKVLSICLGFAFVCAAVTMARAEILKNLKFTGALELQSYGIQNSSDATKLLNDRDGRAEPRLQLGLEFDLTDDAAAKISLVKSNRSYGANDGDNETGAQITGNNSAVNITEAHVTLKNVMGLDWTVGRQYYGTPGDLLVYVGPTDVAGLPVPGGFDAVVAKWSMENAGITAAVGKLGDTNPPDEQDSDIRGLEAYCNAIEGFKFMFRAYSGHGHSAGLNPAVNLYWFSPKVTGEIEGLKFSAEAIMNMGKDTANGIDKFQGTAFLFNAGYNLDLEDMGAFKFSAEYGMGSGDDTADDKMKEYQDLVSDYRPGIIWGKHQGELFQGVLGFGMNRAGLSNLTTFNIGAGYTLPFFDKKLSADIGYYNFKFTKEVGAGLNKNIGNEIDLSATWKHNDNISIAASYAMFSWGKLVKNAMDPVKADKVTRYGADFTVKF